MKFPIVKLLCAVAVAAGTVSYGQQLRHPTYLRPNTISVGSGPSEISLSNQEYPSGLSALWNGSPRPTSRNGNGSYTVALTAADFAAPQLAVITMIDSQTKAVIDTTAFPVTYNVQPTGIAFDRNRNRLYLATPQQSADQQFPPNSIVVLNPTTGGIGPVLQIGNKLGDLALSDDGSALYVVVEGENAVRRFNPGTLTAAGDFNFRPLGTKGTYPNASIYTNDMITVVPGRPATVALAYFPDVGLSPSEIAIFDNGVKRPNVIASSCCGISSLLFSPDAKYFFQNGTTTYSVDTSAFDYRDVTFRYSIDSTGIPKQPPLFASGGGAAAIAGSILYTSLATTIDYEAMRVIGNFGIKGPIAVDSANQRAFVLYNPIALDSSGIGPPSRLVAFDLPSLEPLGSQIVGLSPAALKDSEILIRFGANGFIFTSTAGLLIFHTPLAGPTPVFTASAVVNAASQQSTSVAPGEILTIYGTNLGPPTPQIATAGLAGTLPFALDNVQVWFGRFPGTPLIAYQGQINVVAPFDLQPGATVDLQVWYFGIPSARVSLPIVPAAPALFTRSGSGTGPVSVVNQDSGINTPSPPGSVVTLYGTGGGTFPDAVDGTLARHAVKLSAPIRATIGGREAQVLYTGTAPGLVTGVFQLNVQVPEDTPPGFADIIVSINGQESSRGATLEVR